MKAIRPGDILLIYYYNISLGTTDKKREKKKCPPINPQRNNKHDCANGSTRYSYDNNNIIFYTAVDQVCALS